MSTSNFPPATYIDTHDALCDLARSLANEPLIAVDTESNSLHAYRERVCLIQISTHTADYILDPLAIADLQPLAPVLADPAIEKVFHAAEYDIMCLKRDFGFEVNNVFDTMLAARVCGRDAIGLSSLLEEYAGVKADKRHQRDDWGRRPLPADSLRYAQIDTHYLPLLRDRLWAELEAKGRTAEAREVFADLGHVPAANHHFAPDGYWRIGVPAHLNRREMAILRELYLLREKIAKHRDVPPFKILANKTLVELAQLAPTRKHEMETIRGMTPGQIRRYGTRLLKAVERGKRAPAPELPAQQRAPDPAIMERYMVLHEWRKTRALERGVESDVIVSKDTLWMLARLAPATLDDLQDIRGLGPWRLETYGKELLEVIRRHKNGAG